MICQRCGGAMRVSQTAAVAGGLADRWVPEVAATLVARLGVTGPWVSRRRTCADCGHRVLTVEMSLVDLRVAGREYDSDGALESCRAATRRRLMRELGRWLTQHG